MHSRLKLTVLIVGLCLVAVGCGGDGDADTTTTSPVPETTEATDTPDTTEGGSSTTEAPSDGFAEIEQLAREEGSLNLYTTVDSSITDPMIAAFNETYPEIEVVYTLLVSADAQSRYASERESGAPSADALILGDHLLYDDHPEWFHSFGEGEVPNLMQLESGLVQDHYFDFMSAPYVFAYNTDVVTEPPTEWSELVDPRFTDVNGSLVDPRVSGAFMSGYAFWRELYGDEFLTELVDMGYTFESSSSESREKIASGALGFTTPGVGAPIKPFIDAGAPVDYVTMVPGIALTHAIAINNESESLNAAIVFANWLLSERGQETACAGQYEYLAGYDEIPGCPRAPEGIVVQDAGAAAEEADEILALLGLE